MNYLYVRDNNITSKGRIKNLTEGVKNIEVSDEIFDNSEKYIYSDGNIIPNPDYDKNLELIQKNKRIEEIKSELEKLDLKSIRAIRAGESAIISDLEDKAKNLRAEMEKLYDEL